MPDPDTALGLVALIAFAFVVLGSWMLHARLRNRSSRMLFWSVGALAVWIPVASAVQFFVVGNFEHSRNKDALNWLFVASDIIAPSFLLLVAAISFVLAVRTIARKQAAAAPIALHAPPDDPSPEVDSV